MNKFGETIRKQREQKKLLLRQVAAQLEMDAAMLSKIERGERKAKPEQLVILANLLGIGFKKLKTLWLADKIYAVIEDDENALEALKVAEKEVKYKKQ